MLVPRTFNVMRVVALLAVTALIALMTAFDYEPSDLPFTGGSSDSSDEVTAPTTETFALEPVGEFIAPVEIFDRPGDNHTFVVQLTGSIIALSATSTHTVLDLSDLTLVEGERGLLGAAFHPTEPLLYVHYSNLDGNSVVAEYTFDTATTTADPASAREVLTVEQPYNNHNGGELTFGPDGFLYAGFGDGGLADDPDRSALDLSSRLGKILRIDPRQNGDQAYTVPADNPFVDLAGADPMIWSLGLRNPWRFSFDEASGGLWIADVGQNEWEEVNFAPAGDDVSAGRGMSFGWSAYEGNTRFNEDQAADGHTEPFLAYARTDGKCSISGGAVYRGADESLDGWYLYGDYCTGQIFGFDTAAAEVDREVIELGFVESLVAIAQGANGDLFAASVAGTVYRIG